MYGKLKCVFCGSERCGLCLLRQCHWPCAEGTRKGVHFIWLQISWRWPSPQSCMKPSLFSPLRRTKLFRYKLASSGSYAPVYTETSSQSNPVRMDWEASVCLALNLVFSQKTPPGTFMPYLVPSEKYKQPQQIIIQNNFTLIIDSRAKWSYCFKLGHLHAMLSSSIFPI